MSIYKIHISSNNKINGTNANGYWFIDVPIEEGDLNKDFYIQVESFCFTTSISPAITYPYKILINLPFKNNTYDTQVKCVLPIILSNNTITYQSNRVFSEKIDTKLSSVLCLKSNVWNIQFIFNGSYSNFNWAMILSIFSKDK